MVLYELTTQGFSLIGLIKSTNQVITDLHVEILRGSQGSIFKFLCH